MLPIASTRRRRRKQNGNLISTTSKFGTAIIGAGSLLLASQAIYIAMCTPRLPPPDRSGHEFEEDGLLVCYYPFSSDDNNNSINNVSQEVPEFLLVLIGDSPVEGIGNDTHCKALGGQTALAFSKLLKRPVRYWSYGKSGLTAKGIKEEMVPLLQRVSTKHDVDAVVVSCGVNNVLIGQSAAPFGEEVCHLLDAIIKHTACHTSIIVMELLDFALMPFIPFPLSKVASWRSKTLQSEMEGIVNSYTQQYKYQCSQQHHQQQHRRKGVIGMAYMPPVEEMINDTSHPLLDHITCLEEKNALQLSDFFADDDFHPANHGTIVIGSLLASTYEHLLTKAHSSRTS